MENDRFTRWNTSQESGHFGTGLGESEDVIDEKQDVLPFLVSEIFGNSESSEGHSSSGTWRLVHLSIDQSTL
jgi:hypothetical protein